MFGTKRIHLADPRIYWLHKYWWGLPDIQEVHT